MKPLVIGLTGGFATGKTTVARMFGRLGAEIVDCDEIAHQALIKGTPTYKKVIRLLGRHDICHRNGAIDRKKLAKVVFGDPTERRRLEAIVHPFVFEEIRKRVHAPRKKIVILEAPLLFETNFHKKVEGVLVVSASPQKQMERAEKKLRLETGEAKRRIKAQMPLSGKRKRADFIIHNNGTLKQTALQVRKLWAYLKNLPLGQESRK